MPDLSKGGMTTSRYLLSTLVRFKLYNYRYFKISSVWIKVKIILTKGTRGFLVSYDPNCQLSESIHLENGITCVSYKMYVSN